MGDVDCAPKSIERQVRSHSWGSQIQFMPDAVGLRTLTSSIGVQAPPPPLALKTTHSSDSSLCSCDSSAHVQITEDSLSHQTCPSVVPKFLCLDSTEAQSATDSIGKWSAASCEPPEVCLSISEGSAQTSIALNDDDSTLDILEALRLKPIDSGELLGARYQMSMEPFMQSENWSEEVESLIRQTDEAFKAVGFALSEVKSKAEQRLPNDEILAARTYTPQVTPRDTSQSSSRKRSSILTYKQQVFPRKRVDRNNGNFRPSRRSSPLKVVAHSAQSTFSPRWTLAEVTDEVTDILSGKRFQRVQADEILTPDRVLKLKLENQAAQKSAETLSSVSTTSTDDTLTPLEPFHLQDLPSRIGAAGVNLELKPSPVQDHPKTPVLDIPPIPKKSSRRISSEPGVVAYYQDSDNDSSSGSPTPTEQHSNDSTLQSPPSPPKPHKDNVRSHLSHLPQVATSHSTSQTYGTTNLATIEEVSPVSPLSNPTINRFRRTKGSAWKQPAITSPTSNIANARARRRTRTSGSGCGNRLLTGNNVSACTLESTPFSLTSPSFRHGSIRLNRQQQQHLSLERSTLVSSLPRHWDPESFTQPRQMSCPRIREEKLDWTAFQLAISGGTGDYLMSGSYGNSFGELREVDEADSKEVEDLLDWWESFGIEAGGLVGGSTEAERDPLHATEDRCPSSARTNLIAELPDRHSPPRLLSDIPLVPRPEFRRPSSGIGVQIAELSSAAEIENRAIGSESVSESEAGDRSDGSEDSDCDSLPPSPMLDFTPSAEERVPMGFNLNHDLGDFLKWEAEHVESLIEGH